MKNNKIPVSVKKGIAKAKMDIRNLKADIKAIRKELEQKQDKKFTITIRRKDLLLRAKEMFH